MRRHSALPLITLGLVALLATPGSAAAALGWRPPVDVTPAGGTDVDPSVAVNSKGDAVVAWSEVHDSYNSSVKIARRQSGGAFGHPTLISDPAGTYQWPNPAAMTGQNTDPSVAISESGDVAVVWLRSAPPPDPSPVDLVEAWALPAGGTTGERKALSNGSTTPHYARVAFDGAGNATAFWRQDDRISTAVRPAGGKFGPPQLIANPGISAQDPDYAVAENGDAVAVWGDYGAVYGAVRKGGEAFGAPKLLNTPQDKLAVQHAAIDSRGNATIVWVQRPDAYSFFGSVMTSFRPAGGDFGAPETIGETRTWEASVAMSAAGHTTVAWGSLGGSPYDIGITAVSRSLEEKFGSPETITSKSGFAAPVLAYDAAGTTYAVWRRYTDLTKSIGLALAAVRAPGATFSGDEVPLSLEEGNVWPPVLAAGSADDVLAAWPIGTFPYTFKVQAATYGELASPTAGNDTSSSTAASRPEAPTPRPRALSGPRSSSPLVRAFTARLARRGTAVSARLTLARPVARVVARLFSGGNRSKRSLAGRPFRGRLQEGSHGLTIELYGRVRRALARHAALRLTLRLVLTEEGVPDVVVNRKVRLKLRRARGS
jgi:hypothetical protein